MVDIDEFECDLDAVDGDGKCDAAYPHPLLLEQHKFSDHPEWRERLDKFISGELPKVK